MCIEDLRMDNDWGSIEHLWGQRRSYHQVGPEVVDDLLPFVREFARTEHVPLNLVWDGNGVICISI